MAARRRLVRRRSSRRLMRRRNSFKKRSFRKRKRRATIKRYRKENSLLHKVRGSFEATFDDDGFFKLGINGNGIPAAQAASVVEAIMLQYDTSATTYTALDDDRIGNQLPLTALNGLYQRRRLTGIKLQYVPAYNSFTQGNVVQDGEAAVQYSNQLVQNIPMYILKDMTGIETSLANITEIDVLSNVTGIKVKSLFRPWKMYWKFPKYPYAPKYVMSNEITPFVPDTSNTAGQWIRAAATNTPQDTTEINGTHIGLYVFPIGTNIQGLEGQRFGKFLFTLYFHYADRLGNDGV